jgi:hypothetical protein
MARIGAQWICQKNQDPVQALAAPTVEGSFFEKGARQKLGDRRVNFPLRLKTAFKKLASGALCTYVQSSVQVTNVIGMTFCHCLNGPLRFGQKAKKLLQE